MKGYKAFNEGLKCRGFQYEIGKIYKHNGEIGLCESGFHFCKTASDCANYYDHINSEFAEIEAIGKVIEGDDKCVTDEITIVRLISRMEFYELANNGKNNVGMKNTGNCNTGDWNAGDSNTGNCNTGDSNTGNWNAGDWNATNRSAGFFCTEIQTVKIFDVDTGKTYDELRELLPEILWFIPFGYYRVNDELKPYTAEDRQNFYDKLNDKDKKLIKSIPHFNAEKFEKCTGIKVED